MTPALTCWGGARRPGELRPESALLRLSSRLGRAQYPQQVPWGLPHVSCFALGSPGSCVRFPGTS